MKKLLLTLSLLCVGAGCVAAAGCGETYYQYNFEENGGVEVEDLSVAEGEEFTLPVPVREGYGFEGWYDNADFTGSPVETVVASESATFFAKWAQLYSITVNLDGGSLANADKLALKEGGNVYDYMRDKIPTKSGLTFGAWFVGNSELGSNTRMTTAGITLTAKYKVGYTVEVWKQSATDESSYEKDAEATVSGNEYVGATYTADVDLEGFTVVSNSSAVASKTLTANAAENILKLYFDRINCNVTFVPDYPDGSAGEEISRTVKYGEKVVIPDDLTCAGYCLMGWSTTPNGEVEYEVDSIAATLFNGTKPAATEFQPTRSNTRLYAVWSKGYTNMFGDEDAAFGGNDTIFHLNETDTDIYLLRGGVFFKGTYNASSKAFTFIVNPDLQLIGQLNNDGTYIYRNASRSEVTRNLYVSGIINYEEEIHFDAFNGIRYVVTAQNNTTSESVGTYVVDENGYYVSTFTSGKLAGQTLTIRLVDLRSTSGARYQAFMVRNERDLALGEIYFCGVSTNGGVGIGYISSAYQITLDGFGTATFNTGSGTQSYSYTLDYSDEKPVLKLTSTSSLGQSQESVYYLMPDVARRSETSAGYGYMSYQEKYDRVITSESGSTLTMDGLCNATYVNNGNTFEGYFISNSWSVFGQTVVTIANSEKTLTLIISSSTTEIEGERVTKYDIIEKPAGYKEYFYRGESGVDTSLMLAYNDIDEQYVSQDGSVNVTLNSSAYGEDEDGNLIVVSQGVVTYDEIKRVYKYTAYKYFDVELAENKVDLNDVGSVTFGVGTSTVGVSIISITFNVFYGLDVTTKDGVPMEGVVTTYTSEKEGTLTLTSNYAVYVEDGKRFMGSYTASSDNTNLLRIADNSIGTYAYVVINDEDKTFVSLVTPPYSAYAVLENGVTSKTEYLEFDGTETGVTYFDGTDSHVGTYAATGETTLGGFVVYQFTSEDGTAFKFIRPSTSSAIYFLKYNEKYARTYSLGGVSALTLDGFSLSANFVDEDGVRYDSTIYMIASENVAVVYVNNGYRYFDLKDDGTCTMRGTEYGQYRLTENRYENGVIFELDGYGKAKVFDLNDNPEANSYDDITVFIDENATYTMEDDLVTVVYHNGAETVTVEGKLGAYRYYGNTILLFITINEEIVRTFVSETDWSVMILSDIGNVTKYDAYGVKSEGVYRIITEEYFYYSGTDDEGLFKYSVTNGKMTPVSYSSEEGYYTRDLKSLKFAKYGYAVYNGTTPYYYYMSGAEVFLYKSDPENANANKYGYVRDMQVTAFTDKLNFNGEEYITNSGFDINFERESEGADKYPITYSDVEGKYPVTNLRFSPAGTETFSVSGRINIGNNVRSCTVVRERVDDGFETYVLLSNSTLRLYVELTYGGAGASTYRITDMKNVLKFTSYNYMYGFFSAFLGGAASIPEDPGAITVITQFDENGEQVDNYAYSEFTEASNIVDYNGNLMNFAHAEYELGGSLVINFTGEDGYDYKLGAQINQFMGAYAYVISYIARTQTLTDEASGYSIELSRCVFSETTDVGNFLNDYVIKDSEGNVLEYSAKGTIGDDLYYIVRTYDEDTELILTTTYFKILVKDSENIEDGGLDDEEEDDDGVVIIPLYESVVITPSVMSTYYTEDGKTYLDIDSDNKVWVVNMNNRLYVATECAYDSDTQTYTVTLNNGKTYTIRIIEDKAVLTEVE